MATYNVHVTQSSLFFPDTISGSQSTTFAIGNNGLAQSYFVLETVPLYTTSTPKNTSGSFTLGSGLSGLIQNDYFTSVVVNPGGGNLTFVPAISITGSTLMMKGMGSRNDDLQANAIASSFAAAVNGAGGLLTGSEYNALLTLTSDLISYNLLGKMKAIYPVVSSQRNLFGYTEGFSTGWTKLNTSITASAITPPVNLGGSVYKYNEDAATGYHELFQASFAVETGSLYTTSFYVSGSERSAGYLFINRLGIGAEIVIFNLTNGASSDVKIDSDTKSSLVSVGGGWWKVTITTNSRTATSFNAGVTLLQTYSPSPSPSYTGTPGYGLYIYGAQFDKGDISTPYQITLGSADNVFKNSFKFNLVNPSQFTGSFSSGWTFSPTGMTPNGTSAYMDSQLQPTTQLTGTSTHVSYYSRTSTTTDGGVELGTWNTSYLSGIELALHRSVASTKTYLTINSSAGVNSVLAGNQTSTGLFLGCRTSNSLATLYRNGSSIGTNTNLITPSLSSFNVYIGASNDFGTAGAFSTKQCAFASIGDGLTDTDAFLFYLAVQRYQTLLNRQV